ncbi:MAG: type II toxin-antitoxin system ParD family antitoxin [Phenylobacterium sp.]|nr:type II toxin-antitoxin system ParD family antitoxin [Phenylobacterium sp.]
MSATAKRTISLPEEQSAYIDDQVAAGRYASASEVIRAGLRALRERDDAVERWLQEDVASAFDALQADATRARSPQQVRQSLRARHEGRRKGQG